MVDVNKILKDTFKKATVKVGEKQTKSAINKGDAKIIVISNNCVYTDEINTLVKENKIPLFKFEGTGVELGSACGKKFVVSSFAVIDEKDTNIMQLVKKENKNV